VATTEIPSTQKIFSRLKTRQLQLLLALAQARSLRKAAALVNMTQPAATNLIFELEDTLGVKLFDRQSRGVVPTEYGMVMIRHAQMMLSDVDHAREEIAALQSGATGRMAIGCISNVVPFLIAQAVTKMKRERPGMLVSIEVDSSNVLLPGLEEGRLDLVVARPLESAPGASFVYEQLLNEPLTLVGRVGHPLMTGSAPLTENDLRSWPWVLLPATTPMRRVLEPTFGHLWLNRSRNLIETSSTMMMIALLQGTDALAVVPDNVAQYHRRHGMLDIIPFALPPIMGSYGIITRQDRPMSPAAEEFIQILRDTAAETWREPSR
jgi:DNA-binding transcriptional LysR family regulator